MKYPIFGFDIDDVIFNTYIIIADQLKRLYGIDLWEPKGFSELEKFLNPTQYCHVIDSALCDRVDEIIPINGAIDFLKLYQNVINKQIVFITSRHPIQKEATFYMLNKWLPDIDYRVRFIKEENRTKGDVAAEEQLAVFIEDRVKYSIDIASRGIMVLMPDRSWNVKYQDPLCRNRIIRVRDFADINLVFSTILQLGA